MENKTLDLTESWDIIHTAIFMEYPRKPDINILGDKTRIANTLYSFMSMGEVGKVNSKLIDDVRNVLYENLKKELTKVLEEAFDIEERISFFPNFDTAWESLYLAIRKEVLPIIKAAGHFSLMSSDNHGVFYSDYLDYYVDANSYILGSNRCNQRQHLSFIHDNEYQTMLLGRKVKLTSEEMQEFRRLAPMFHKELTFNFLSKEYKVVYHYNDRVVNFITQMAYYQLSKQEQ